MTDQRVIDFDLYRAEREDEAILFRIGGEEYALPSSMPASVAVDTIRMKSSMDDDDDVPVEALDSFGASIFGPTIWEALLRKHRITVDELEPLIGEVLAVYSGPKAEEEETPTETSSETLDSTSASSKTGRGSKQTS